MLNMFIFYLAIGLFFENFHNFLDLKILKNWCLFWEKSFKMGTFFGQNDPEKGIGIEARAAQIKSEKHLSL